MLNENLIAQLAKSGVVTETFRKLPPDKKELVYRRGIALFGTYGYDGLAVDRICRTCAISKGSFFQYFPSKAHLLEFCLLVFDDDLAIWIADIRRREKTALARDRIRYLYHEIVVNSKLHRAEQTFYLFATRGLRHAGVTIEGIDLERHFREYIAEIILRGELTGEIRGDFDIEQTAYLVSVMVDGIVARRFSNTAPTGVGVGEYLISFLFDGIKA